MLRMLAIGGCAVLMAACSPTFDWRPVAFGQAGAAQASVLAADQVGVVRLHSFFDIFANSCHTLMSVNMMV